jgi:Fur family ferric uptake transcriptional regulator
MERLTRQKQAVLTAIEQSGRSLNPTEIQALAQREVPSLNLSTVYRQLKVLLEEARVVKVDLPGQPARFEALCDDGAHRASQAKPHAHQPHHHHHFHCMNCDQVFPIHGCPGPMTELAPAGFMVERHDLTLHGRCASCAKGAA